MYSTICLPYYLCNKKCPYCISKTYKMEDNNNELFMRNFPKYLKYLNSNNINKIIFTSCGETLMDQSLIFITKLFINFPELKDFITEIQTNGLNLNSDTSNKLYDLGFNTVAVSIDGLYGDSDVLYISNACNKNLIYRLSYNFNTLSLMKPKTLISVLKCTDFSELLIRKLDYPKNVEPNKYIQWIKDYGGTDDEFYKFVDELYEHFSIRYPHHEGHYDVFGNSLRIKKECFDDNNNNSVVYLNGHLYRGFNQQVTIF